MIAAIHQPNFLPWQGYFYKMRAADVFVYLDSVQFTKGGFQNRTQIKTERGVAWLTVPVLTKGRFGVATADVEINAAVPWSRKHLGTLEAAYRTAPYFDEVMSLLEPIYRQRWSHLVPFCMALLDGVCAYLGIKTSRCLSSTMTATGASTELLVSILRHVGADTYISGRGGARYQDEETYRQAGIRLIYSDFTPQPYPQLHGAFVPRLSIVDGLFNVGRGVLALVTQ